MKFSFYPMLVAGLLIIGGCKSPMLGSALNEPVSADLNPVEGFNQSRDYENGSIRPASFETFAQENRQQTSPPGRVAIEDYLKRGHIAGRQGHIGEAKKFYELVLESDPENVKAHHRLAVIADKQQDFSTAERHYKTALRYQPYDSDMLADFGYSYFLQKRFDESEQYLSKALQSDPSHLRTLNNLGLLYGTMGDYDRALGMLRRTGSESEARAKLAKIFPRAESPTPNSSQFPSGSQRSNPLASRELTAPNPRGLASGNFQAVSPQVNHYVDQQRMPPPYQGNFDSTRTVGNTANPLRPAVPSAVNPHLPTDAYRGFSGGINIAWPQPKTQPQETTRLQPKQFMPQQNQPFSTLPQPILTGARPVQEPAAAPNRLLPAPGSAAGQTQFPNGDFTNFGNQDSYQASSTSGVYNEPFNQTNPVNTGFPDYPNRQLSTQSYSNPNGSTSNPPTNFPSFNQSGTTMPKQLQGNRYSPQTASPYSASDFQFQKFPEAHTANGLAAGYPNRSGNQPEAFRLYDQRRSQQDASGQTLQRFPQSVPQQQPRIVPAWPQDSQQFPAAQSPRIQLGLQPNPQGMANPSLLR
jgi:hypothetical protein